MKEFNITYSGGGRPTPPVMAKDHLSAIRKSARESLGASFVRNHCKIIEIELKTWNRTYFTVTDGNTEKHFAVV